jgi:drug/metabolite transporter (DMT)-like permease
VKVPSSSRPLGVAAAVVTTTAWGGQFVVGKSAFAYLDPVWLTALRYAAASVVFLALLALAEGRAGFRADPALLRVAVLGTVGFAGFNLLVYVGLTRTSPQAASLIVSTMPLITAFVLWARTKVRPRAVTWWSSGIALLGVGLVLTDGHLGALLDGGLNGGDLLVLVGAASWVVYTTGAATVPHWSPLRYTAISAAAGSVVIVAIALAGTAAGWLRLPTTDGVVAAGWQLAYVALVAAVVAVLCWNAAMRTLGPQDGVLFINLVPVTTFAVEAFLGHVPHVWQLVGAAVTLTALVGNNVLTRRPRPAATPAVLPSVTAAVTPAVTPAEADTRAPGGGAALMSVAAPGQRGSARQGRATGQRISCTSP